MYHSSTVRQESASLVSLHRPCFHQPFKLQRGGKWPHPMDVVPHSSLPIQRPPPPKQRPLHRNIQTRWAKSSIGYDEESENENDGLYLDEETYLQAEDKLLRSDGSLNLNTKFQETHRSTSSLSPLSKTKDKTYQLAVEGLFSPPPSYSYAGNDDESDATKSKPFNAQDEAPAMDAETLHQQVFAEEQTYLEQSEEFRKSLSSPYSNESESPMAKERREIIEKYNEQVLGDLMMQIDEMEDMSLSREEAMKQASEHQKDVVCPRCGLPLTPDMIQRAKALATGSDGMPKKADGILCVACYGQQLRTTEEAKVRLGAGLYGYESPSAKMFDRKNSHRRASNNKNYKGRSKGRGDRKEGTNHVRGIDTSSMFQLPKGYNDAEGKRDTEPKPSVNTDRPTPNSYSDRSRVQPKGNRESKSSIKTNSPSSNDMRQTWPRSKSRNLGDRELAKRMQQSNDDNLEQQITQRTSTAFNAQKSNSTPKTMPRRNISPKRQINPDVPSEIGKINTSSLTSEDKGSNANSRSDRATESDKSEQWVKVEDPSSNGMFYWNTSTGEMKKTLD